MKACWSVSSVHWLLWSINSFQAWTFLQFWSPMTTHRGDQNCSFMFAATRRVCQACLPSPQVLWIFSLLQKGARPMYSRGHVMFCEPTAYYITQLSLSFHGVSSVDNKISTRLLRPFSKLVFFEDQKKRFPVVFFWLHPFDLVKTTGQPRYYIDKSAKFSPEFRKSSAQELGSDSRQLQG